MHRQWRCRKASPIHVGEHVLLRRVQQGGELGQLGANLVGDLAPLRPGGVGMILSEGGGDEGRDHAPATPAGMGQRVAHEVHPAALPSGAKHAGDRGLDALVRIRDHQLDPGQAAALQLAQEVDREGLGLRGADGKPRTSRRPSVLTATAMVTATDTMRPASRTLT